MYLVFEFVDHTALDDLDKFPSGADETYVKKVMWQVLKGIEFCHQHNVRIPLLVYTVPFMQYTISLYTLFAYR